MTEDRQAIAHDPDYCDKHRPRGWTCNQPHAAAAMRAELPDPVAPRPCFCDGPWENVEPEGRPETRLGREHIEGEPGCVYAVHYHQPDPDDTPTGRAVQAHIDLVRDALTYCNSCDQPADELDAAGYCPECRAAANAIPAGAELVPWDASDDAELARISWSWAIRGGRRQRVDRGAAFRLTEDELATAAARFGIVADPDALPWSAIHQDARAVALDAAPTTRWSADATDTRAYVALAKRTEAIDRQRETGDVWANARRHFRGRHIIDTLRATGSCTVPDWADDILNGSALPFPESRQRADHDFAESHPGRYASWPIVQAAR